MAPPSLNPPSNAPGYAAPPIRPARSWGIILLGVFALLLGLGGLALALVPCVMVLSLYFTIPALALGVLLLGLAFWRKTSKGLAIVTILVSGLGLAFGWRTYSEAVSEKPTVVELLERKESFGRSAKSGQERSDSVER